MEKEIRIRAFGAPNYGDLHMRFSVLERSETRIMIKETHVTSNVPYSDDYEIWILWEVATDSPLSNLVAFRKTYMIEWFYRNWVAGTIEN